MRNLMLFTLLVVALASQVSAQTTESPRGMYTYSVFNQKPLAVGTPVWVNVGDTECAYGEPGRQMTDLCLAEYRKAVIIEAFRWLDNKTLVYRVDIETHGKFSDGMERNAPFDDLYEMFNLPSEMEEYSKYFLLLNW